MKKYILLNKGLITLSLICLLLASCQSKKNENIENSKIFSKLDFPERPNILWLVTEDMGSYIEPFGDSTAHTPNLNKLANEGVIYPNMYSPSGVCAPSRAAIATGMYPSSIGANHMRTTSYTEVTGLPSYEAVPNPEVKMISELLRMNGYYCTNNSKQDYQFNAPVTAWNESSRYAHWRNRAANQPFFSIFNFTQTHESGLFEPYGFKKSELRHYQSGEKNNSSRSGLVPEEEVTMHLPKNTSFNIPPYLPDTEVVRRDLWKMYNNIAEMDKQLGAILKQLEDDGLLESTIIFFYGDHGGPLPRQKRLIYDSGLNTPLIIRFPNKQKSGTKDSQLVSFVDFAPTLLSLIGIEPEKHLQGQAFLGNYQAKEKRKYVHAAADRFDGFTDAIRAVRSKQYKYIRNYRPEQGYYLPVTYRERIPTMQELLRLKDEKKLNQIQAQWFRENKPLEELYDCNVDPHELNNLANDSTYNNKLQELRKEMNDWLEDIGDQPNLPERELIGHLWKGKDIQPVTNEPIITSSNGKVTISTTTNGASIAYKVIDIYGTKPKEWTVYQNPIAIPSGNKLLVQAHRIGFKPSKTIEIRVIDLN